MRQPLLHKPVRLALDGPVLSARVLGVLVDLQLLVAHRRPKLDRLLAHVERAARAWRRAWTLQLSQRGDVYVIIR